MLPITVRHTLHRLSRMLSTWLWLCRVTNRHLPLLCPLSCLLGVGYDRAGGFPGTVFPSPSPGLWTVGGLSWTLDTYMLAEKKNV